MPQVRKYRIESEVLMIAEHYSIYEGVFFDEENCDWLIIPKYPLPSKWKERWCQLLIIFPDVYPVSPPTGFYLNKKFKLKHGGYDSHLIGAAHYGAADLTAQNWFWYCVTIENGPGGWRPSSDYRRSDNLWTFLSLIRDCLTNDV
jgi:hypothetical protein